MMERTLKARLFDDGGWVIDGNEVIARIFDHSTAREDTQTLVDRWNTHDSLVEALDGLLTGVFVADGDKMRCGVCGRYEGSGHDPLMVCAGAEEALARAKAV